MTAAPALLVFFVLCALGISAVLLAPERWQPRVVAWAGALAALPLAWAGVAALTGPATPAISSLWRVPPLGTITVGIDRLSGLFLLVTAAVYLPASIFVGAGLPGANVFAMRLFSALLFATCALTNLPACSGAECHGTQENFSVTPSESCLEPVLDACDAEIGALTLQNNCSDALVIPESGRSAGAPDTGVVDSTQVEVTIAPSENAYFSCTAFADASNGKLWHVTIPALLGSSSITISFDIAR
jgi:hypothetical protein